MIFMQRVENHTFVGQEFYRYLDYILNVSYCNSLSLYELFHKLKYRIHQLFYKMIKDNFSNIKFLKFRFLITFHSVLHYNPGIVET